MNPESRAGGAAAAGKGSRAGHARSILAEGAPEECHRRLGAPGPRPPEAPPEAPLLVLFWFFLFRLGRGGSREVEAGSRPCEVKNRSSSLVGGNPRSCRDAPETSTTFPGQRQDAEKNAAPITNPNSVDISTIHLQLP